MIFSAAALRAAADLVYISDFFRGGAPRRRGPVGIMEKSSPNIIIFLFFLLLGFQDLAGLAGGYPPTPESDPPPS